MWIEIVLTTLIVIVFWNIIKKPPNYPPGIWGWPVVGYVPLGRRKFDKKLEDLKTNYGKIFCWRMGEQLVVFINDFEYIKESFKSGDLAYRPQVEYLTFLIGIYNQGIGMPHSQYWQTVRRFTLRQMRDLGMGKSKLTSTVHYEAAELVKSMKKNAGEIKPLSSDIRVAVINILWQIIASKRYEFDEKTVLQYDEAFAQFMASLARIVLVDIFPWLKRTLPTSILNFVTKRHHHEILSNILEQQVKQNVEEHINTFVENNPRDYIDEFLIEMKKKNGYLDPKFSVKDLVVSLADLFGAGFQSTATTLTWAIYYLTKFPNVQKKLQQEIDEVLPNGIQVTLEDKLRLPYTEAFIWEVLRYSAQFRFVAPRTVMEDKQIGKYIIPKNSVIFGFTEALHYSSKFFDSPQIFRPERFLNDIGKFSPPKEGFLPFGIGKRLCIGESLARMEMLIFIVTLVQHLEFSIPVRQTFNIQPVDNPLINLPNLNQNIFISDRMTN